MVFSFPVETLSNITIQTYKLQSKRTNYNPNVQITIQTYKLQSKRTNYNPNVQITFQTYKLQSKRTNYNPNVQITIQTYKLQSKRTNYNPNVQITIQTYKLQSKRTNYNPNIEERKTVDEQHVVTTGDGVDKPSDVSIKPTGRQPRAGHEHPSLPHKPEEAICSLET